MRVLFDISQTGATKAGCGYFAHSLATALARAGRIDDLRFARTFGASWWDPANEDLVIDGEFPRRPHYEFGFADVMQARAFWDSEGDALEAMLKFPDIIHSNNFFSPPTMTSVKQVFTLYDMTVFDCPQFTTPANQAACLCGTLDAAVNADWIVAISEATKRDFLDYFDYDPSRISVISLGSRSIDLATSTKPWQISSEPFVLAVGTIEPRKNYDTLLRAMHALAGQDAPRLVIAGKLGWQMNGFADAIAALDLNDKVTLLSYVSDEELDWLYRNAVCLVFPSFWEGFGLPVLEAMEKGCPVICSSTTSLPEVAGDAGILVSPDAVAAIAAAILDVHHDPDRRAKMVSRGLEQAGRFSWTSGADALIAIYQNLLDPGRVA